jgi:hypothetical protein
MTPEAWLKANGANLAPLTGQDRNTLRAIAACWEAYAAADEDGRAHVVAAVRLLLLAMQPKCRILTRELIARSLDWDVVDLLWRVVSV